MKKKLKIHHIGCTHMTHEQLDIPKDTDLLIHSGDWSNYRDVVKNEIECKQFVEWVGKELSHIPHKVFVPGNHNVFEFENLKWSRRMWEKVGVKLLIDEHVEIEGYKIFGSPYVPTYGDWVFMADRGKLYKRWCNAIDDDIDILITHGPPKGILDLNCNLQPTGDSALLTRIQTLHNLKLHMFSHIHSNSEQRNTGVLYRDGVYYSNAAVVKDGEKYKAKYNGNTFILENNKINLL